MEQRDMPVTLILLWNPKKTTGWRGVKARWTSESEEICSVFFSGECSTQVCSASKSQDRMVQSYKISVKHVHHNNYKEYQVYQTITSNISSKKVKLIHKI